MCDEIVIVLCEIDCLFNVLMGFVDGNLSVVELIELGVKCISVGVMLVCVVMGVF